MPLPAIPVIIAGAMKLYRGYQIAKFAKCAYSTMKNENLLKEDGTPHTKISKMVALGKSAINAADGLVLGGKAGVLLNGVKAVNTMDNTVNFANKFSALKDTWGESSGKGLLAKLGSLKDTVGVLSGDTKPSAEKKIKV